MIPKILIAGLLLLLLAPCIAAVATECSPASYGSWVCGTDGNAYECGREYINDEWVFAWQLKDCRGTGCTIVDLYGDDTVNLAVCNSRIVSERPTQGGACIPGDLYLVDCILGDKNTVLYTCSSSGIWVGGDRDSVCSNEVYLKYGGVLTIILIIYLVFTRKPPHETILKKRGKP